MAVGTLLAQNIYLNYYLSRPGANTTKYMYNHQRDNLLMGHVHCTNSAWSTQCVQVEKMHGNTILEELTGT